MTIHFPFQNTYSALPANFFARVAPTPVAAPRLIKLNRTLAFHLGLDPDVLESPEGTEILAGKRLPDGADPREPGAREPGSREGAGENGAKPPWKTSQKSCTACGSRTVQRQAKRWEM